MSIEKKKRTNIWKQEKHQIYFICFKLYPVSKKEEQVSKNHVYLIVKTLLENKSFLWNNRKFFVLEEIKDFVHCNKYFVWKYVWLFIKNISDKKPVPEFPS